MDKERHILNILAGDVPDYYCQRCEVAFNNPSGERRDPSWAWARGMSPPCPECRSRSHVNLNHRAWIKT